MKFLFEKFIAPRATGRYGSGDMAAIGTMIFPYLFVRFVSVSVAFFDVRISTASYMYFFPIMNPRYEPISEPSIVDMIAR